MNRRQFLYLAALAPAARAQQGTAPAPRLYYVDGYHGGVRGHMPPGAWRDILNVMRETPAWKLCLDVEPASWDVLRREDPLAYREVQEYFKHQAVTARVEIVNGTFAQPFGWANGGESNIRQIARGTEIIRRHFPEAVIETYAVQEPCWASCLPQILRSFGFTGAVLKNPSTAWGGYSAGFDAEVANWVGPDGTSIPAVPRYACEELVKTWETESVTGSPAFARKCVERGIQRPSGMCFQDLGWAAKPKVSGDHIQFVTWREYMRSIAAKPSKDWHFTVEDILVTLPWGEKTLQAAAQQVRSAENRLLVAEKMAALSWLEHKAAWPATRLCEAWDQVLWSQHHDSWITVTTRMGRRAWAFQVGAQTLAAEQTADEIIGESARVGSIGHGGEIRTPLGAQYVRVFNTLGMDRRELAEATIAADRGTSHVRVFDSSGNEVPAQVIASRRYAPRRQQTADAEPETINTATVLFPSNIPSLGYSTYRVEPVYQPVTVPKRQTVAAAAADGIVTIENDFYRLRLDPARGGAIVSLFAKEQNREFCDPAAPRLMNEYRGYFIAQEKWRSSAEESARVSVVESGPLRARVRVAGRVGGCPYQTTITLAEGHRRIDFQARFTFEQETWIGDPWDIKPQDRRTERRRSQNDGRWKLNALFPVSFGNQVIHKNAAYDVCRSRNADTFFQGWHEIKHNIVLHWVDVMDEKDKTGLAVLCDHTTAYTHGPEHPLGLVMAWGWEGGFWWGKCPLKGTQQVSYGLVPHRGMWDESGIAEETARWNEPLFTQLVDGGPPPGTETRSLVSVSGAGVEIPTVLVDGSRVNVRLFNSSGGGEERTVSFALKPLSVEMVELDGRLIKPLEITNNGGRHGVKLTLPRFGIRTLRCEFPGRA